MEEINTYTDEEIEGALSYLGHIYQDTTHSLTCEEDNIYQKELHHTIEEVAVYFTGAELQILLNDILLPVQKNWWKAMYTQRKYTRKKKEVMRKFFDCLNR